MDPITASLLLAGGSALAGGLSAATRNKGQFNQVPRLTPNQMAGQDQALQRALSGLQNPGAGFEPIANQEVKRFNQETIPSLAERFTAMGNGQRSSAFQGALGNAASGLSGQLAALKAQYGLQQQGLLQNLLGLGLQPQFDSAYTQPRDNFLSGGLSGASSGLGALSGVYGLQGSMNAAPNGLSNASIGPLLASLLGGNQQQPGTVPGAAQDVASLQSPVPSNPTQGFNGQQNFENFLRQRLAALY